MNNAEVQNILNRIKESWGAPTVARSQVPKMTGGLVAVQTLTNADSQGVGPDKRFRMGRKIFYETDSLLAWLEPKITVEPPRMRGIEK